MVGLCHRENKRKWLLLVSVLAFVAGILCCAFFLAPKSSFTSANSTGYELGAIENNGSSCWFSTMTQLAHAVPTWRAALQQLQNKATETDASNSDIVHMLLEWSRMMKGLDSGSVVSAKETLETALMQRLQGLAGGAGEAHDAGEMWQNVLTAVEEVDSSGMSTVTQETLRELSRNPLELIVTTRKPTDHQPCVSLE
ncbi:MAG: hypothetical protein MHM6MM_002184 [Cercozoa sp. M6MM]